MRSNDVASHLDEAEHAHLYDLARAANTTPRTRRPRASQQQIRPGVQRILDGLTQMPAIVHNGRLDILSANMLGYALFSPIYVESARGLKPVVTAMLTEWCPPSTPQWMTTAHRPSARSLPVLGHAPSTTNTAPPATCTTKLCAH
jgi:hypothetical protein